MYLRVGIDTLLSLSVIMGFLEYKLTERGQGSGSASHRTKAIYKICPHIASITRTWYHVWAPPTPPHINIIYLYGVGWEDIVHWEKHVITLGFYLATTFLKGLMSQVLPARLWFHVVHTCRCNEPSQVGTTYTHQATTGKWIHMYQVQESYFEATQLSSSYWKSNLKISCVLISRLLEYKSRRGISEKGVVTGLHTIQASTDW